MVTTTYGNSPSSERGQPDPSGGCGVVMIKVSLPLAEGADGAATAHRAVVSPDLFAEPQVVEPHLLSAGEAGLGAVVQLVAARALAGVDALAERKALVVVVGLALDGVHPAEL